MRKLVVPVLLSLVLLCGCTRHYVMRMNNGARITTLGKPKVKGNNYVFKDTNGQMRQVSQGRVMTIEPASMAKEEKNPFMLPAK